MLHWRNMDWPAARHAFESLLKGDDIYARSAALKLAQLDAVSRHGGIVGMYINAIITGGPGRGVLSVKPV